MSGIQCPVCGFEFKPAPNEHTPPVGQSASLGLSVFQREGEYWFIGYEADAFRLRDTKGLRYLHMLLRSPGREILALHVVQHANVNPMPASHSAPLHPEAGLRLFVPGDADDVLDDTARLAYEQRVRDLGDEVRKAESQGDSGRAGLLKEEMDFIVDHLAAASGLGGRRRREASPAERARQSVTKAIKSAVSRIAEHSPALQRHFSSTVRTGTYCIYQPDPRIPLRWRL